MLDWQLCQICYPLEIKLLLLLLLLGDPVELIRRVNLSNAGTICQGLRRREPIFAVYSRTLLECPSSLLKWIIQWSQLFVYSKGFSTFVYFLSVSFCPSYIIRHSFLGVFV